MRSWLLVFGIAISIFGLYFFGQQASFLVLTLGIILLRQFYKLDAKEKQNKSKPSEDEIIEPKANRP
jgi:hypothetical protein